MGKNVTADTYFVKFYEEIKLGTLKDTKPFNTLYSSDELDGCVPLKIKNSNIKYGRKESLKAWKKHVEKIRQFKEPWNIKSTMEKLNLNYLWALSGVSNWNIVSDKKIL